MANHLSLVRDTPPPATLTRPRSMTEALAEERRRRVRELAERHEFEAMCRVCLLGSETDQDDPRFGEFLELQRAVLDGLAPATQLELIGCVSMVDAQWRVQRLRRLRVAMFGAAPRGTCRDGWSLKLDAAMKVDKEIENAQREADRAVTAYRRLARLG